MEDIAEDDSQWLSAMYGEDLPLAIVYSTMPAQIGL